uniref:Phosphatidylglycerophosphatase A n=1 Tax=Heterorhabditis bacteriophora TaxID=37862 RepID=A0A1I7WRE8_HETBA
MSDILDGIAYLIFILFSWKLFLVNEELLTSVF